MPGDALKTPPIFGPIAAPHKNDPKLFGFGDDFQSNAFIAHWDVQYAYSSGYRAAAFALAKEVCEAQNGRDRLVYPIVYLYRHHIELILKSIIIIASSLLDRDMFESPHGHRLYDLWTILRPLLNPVCALVPEEPFALEDIDGVEWYIAQLNEHDPDGQRFRYATTKQGKKITKDVPSLKEDLVHINIRVFAEGMEKLANYLEGIEAWFSDLIDAKLEWQRRSILT